jgi:propanediol dehydratase small subunit
MDQEELIHTIMAEVMRQLGKDDVRLATKPATNGNGPSGGGRVTSADYPLAERMTDSIRTSTGKKLTDISLKNIMSGQLRSDDLRISKETLELQAQVAESVGRTSLARNMRRASELIAVPDDELLKIYNALRPYRSTKKEMCDIADGLERNYGCVTNAAFIRQAADVYERRGRLKRAE